jgi:hypothetical protein
LDNICFIIHLDDKNYLVLRRLELSQLKLNNKEDFSILASQKRRPPLLLHDG